MNTISRKIAFSAVSAIVAAFPLVASVAGQSADSSASQGSWLPYILVAGLLFAAAFFLWKRSQKPGTASQYDYENRVQGVSVTYNSSDGVDAEKELEWFRKARRSKEPSGGIRDPKVERRVSPPRRASDSAPEAALTDEESASAKAFQDKMRRMQFAQLPINSFIHLTAAREFTPLSISSDPALLSAIEQSQDEYEDDEAVREIAVKILARFRTRNSVESLSQMALYDLSSNLRSKAVNILAEFDHESVFETLLLACADPTREVRAAAARGLFRLSFDRAEAWKRIMATGDKFRMSHAARAAVEAGIVTKSIDRLLHADMKIAYEAFVLMALAIRADEAEVLYNALANSPDERAKLAILHVFDVANDETAAKKLRRLDTTRMSGDVVAKINEVISATELAAV